MLNGLPGCDPLVGVHVEHVSHEVDLYIIHNPSVPSLNSLWVSDLRELEALIANVTIELVLEEVWQLSEDLLNNEELIDLGVTWEQWLAVH